MGVLSVRAFAEPVSVRKLRNQDYGVLTGTDRGGESRGQIRHTGKKKEKSFREMAGSYRETLFFF